MASEVRARRQPCTGCGDTVVIVESSVAGLGGLWRLRPATRVQHADPAQSGAVDDGVDDACHRPRVR